MAGGKLSGAIFYLRPRCTRFATFEPRLASAELS